MDDRSFEAMQLQEISSVDETEYLHHENDDAADFAAVNLHNETNDRSDVSTLQVSHNSAEEDSRNPQPLVLLASDLSEVPVKYDLRRDEVDRLKNHLQGSHQEALATVIAQAALINLPVVGVPSSFTRLPATPATPTMNADVAEADHKDATGSKSLSASNPVEIPVDGYTWRKYGQKQVKSPQGSRSYYKCTYSACDAKKLEFCDQFNSIIKVVYKGKHKHDLPKRVILSTPKSLKRKSISTLRLKEHQSSNVPIDSSEIKQRLKRNNSGTVLKHPKKSKFIVHAAADMEISADGYRWRKYGQKMVKGNPHPRNYYKCTCAGCTVKKHIEKVVNDSSKVIITYKGVHNHDTPVPKKGRPHVAVLLLPLLQKTFHNPRKRDTHPPPKQPRQRSRLEPF